MLAAILHQVEIRIAKNEPFCAGRLKIDFDPRVRALNPMWRLAELENEVKTARTEDQAVTRADLRRRVEQCLAITRAGGNIIMGTDSPIDDLAVSSHMNLRAMVEYGYTPRQALMTATSAAGRYLA